MTELPAVDTALVAAVAALLNEQARRDNARRTERERLEQAKAGWYAGGRRPYGYRPDPAAPKHAKTLLVVEDEADEIRAWVSRVLARVPLRAITADLRARGVPSVHGGTWDTATVRDVLTKPSIAGLAVYQVRQAAQAYKDRGEPVPCDCGVVGPAGGPRSCPRTHGGKSQRR